MSGSLDLKRKQPMEEGNNVTTVEDIFNQGKGVSTDRSRAILHSMLDEMLDMGYLFDHKAEKDRLGLKLLRANSDLQAIKVTFIDWDNNGEK
ncbi:hypothetical protein Bca4012_065603 [Brassica carinata]